MTSWDNILIDKNWAYDPWQEILEYLHVQKYVIMETPSLFAGRGLRALVDRSFKSNSRM